MTGRLASPGCLLTWKPAMGPAFCLFDAKLHHQHVRQRTRINGKDTPAVQGLPTMMRPVPIVMPELKQRKQKLGKATGSRNDDSVSRRCHRCILLGQGPCALAKCFASTETRRHDVGRAASAESSPSRSGLLCLHWRRTTVCWCLDKKFPGLADEGPASRMPAAEVTPKAQSPPCCCKPGRPACSGRGLRQPAALKVPPGPSSAAGPSWCNRQDVPGP